MCGPESKIVSTDEPSRCVYEFKVETPAACHHHPEKLLEIMHSELWSTRANSIHMTMVEGLFLTMCFNWPPSIFIFNKVNWVFYYYQVFTDTLNIAYASKAHTLEYVKETSYNQVKVYWSCGSTSAPGSMWNTKRPQQGYFKRAEESE